MLPATRQAVLVWTHWRYTSSLSAPFFVRKGSGLERTFAGTFPFAPCHKYHLCGCEVSVAKPFVESASQVARAAPTNPLARDALQPHDHFQRAAQGIGKLRKWETHQKTPPRNSLMATLLWFPSGEVGTDQTNSPEKLEKAVTVFFNTHTPHRRRGQGAQQCQRQPKVRARFAFFRCPKS